MSGDDPFAEPDDTDRTVIKPNPGGRRPAAPMPTPQPSAQPAAEQAPAAASEPALDAFGIPGPAPDPVADARPKAQQQAEVELVLTGMNRLNACAAPLFSLISRIRNRAQHMDADKLRSSVVSEVRAFENRALQAGIPAQTVKAARYAL